MCHIFTFRKPPGIPETNIPVPGSPSIATARSSLAQRPPTVNGVPNAARLSHVQAATPSHQTSNAPRFDSATGQNSDGVVCLDAKLRLASFDTKNSSFDSDRHRHGLADPRHGLAAELRGNLGLACRASHEAVNRVCGGEHSVSRLPSINAGAHGGMDGVTAAGNLTRVSSCLCMLVRVYVCLFFRAVYVCGRDVCRCLCVCLCKRCLCELLSMCIHMYVCMYSCIYVC
jgi:hypothetical protein